MTDKFNTKCIELGLTTSSNHNDVPIYTTMDDSVTIYINSRMDMQNTIKTHYGFKYAIISDESCEISINYIIKPEHAPELRKYMRVKYNEFINISVDEFNMFRQYMKDIAVDLDHFHFKKKEMSQKCNVVNVRREFFKR